MSLQLFLYSGVSASGQYRLTGWRGQKMFLMVFFLIMVASLSTAAFIVVSLRNRKIQAELKSLQYYEHAASKLISENEIVTDEFVINFLETLLDMMIHSFIVFGLSPNNPQIKKILSGTSNLTHLQSEIILSRLLGKYRFKPLPTESIETFSVEEVLKEATQLSHVKEKRVNYAESIDLKVKMPVTMARFTLCYILIAAEQFSVKNEINISWVQSASGVDITVKTKTDTKIEESKAYQACIKEESESFIDNNRLTFASGLELAKELTRIYKGKIIISGQGNQAEFLIHFPSE